MFQYQNLLVEFLKFRAVWYSIKMSIDVNQRAIFFLCNNDETIFSSCCEQHPCRWRFYTTDITNILFPDFVSQMPATSDRFRFSVETSRRSCWAGGTLSFPDAIMQWHRWESNRCLLYTMWFVKKCSTFGTLYHPRDTRIPK